MNEYFSIPNNKIVSILIKILSNLYDLPRLIERENDSHRDGTCWELIHEGNYSLLCVHKPNVSDIKINISLLRNTSSSEKLLNSAKKILIFLLMKMNHQCQHRGILQRDDITFHLQELVDCGLYGSVKSARQGVLATKDVLLAIQVMGYDNVGGENGKKKIVISSPLYPFIDFGISHSLCFVTINPSMDITFFCQAYAIVPKEIFLLSNRGFSLLWYICFLARQNIKKLVSGGCFMLSIRTIQALLSLPEEEKNKDVKRTIKQPVEDAVRDIIEATHGNIKIEIVKQETSIKEYLKKGYLRIEMNSTFIKYYRQVFENKNNYGKKL